MRLDLHSFIMVKLGDNVTIEELVGHVRTELSKINPELVDLYKINDQKDGVQLIRGETSIITIPGNEDTLPYVLLYQICPRINGKGLIELFNRADDVVNVDTLEEAVNIAECALGAKYSPFLYQKLQELV